MIFDTLKFIISHPLNRHRRIASLIDWFRWQVGSRLLPGAVEVPFVNDAVLMVEPGMAGATGNIYAGLVEFEDMGFLLHFLGSDDLFVDIGANVGIYTVLASKVIGARSVAVEALPATYEKLMKNMIANDIVNATEAWNCALGDKDGEIHFTSELDTMNHVVVEADTNADHACSVAVKRLDDILDGQVPRLIKIDVEGYETPVIAGAMETLKSLEQEAVIMELNGCGRRYGFEDSELHQKMLGFGYIPVTYSPLSRDVRRLQKPNIIGNTIYLRESSFHSVCARVKVAPSFYVKGQNI